MGPTEAIAAALSFEGDPFVVEDIPLLHTVVFETDEAMCVARERDGIVRQFVGEFREVLKMLKRGRGEKVEELSRWRAHWDARVGELVR